MSRTIEQSFRSSFIGTSTEKALGGAMGQIERLFSPHRPSALSNELDLRYEERVVERMRIARELHDTIFQGFLSASMQLHVAMDRIPEDSPAKPQIGHALTLMKRVLDEGRNAVRALRSSGKDTPDLQQALSRIRDEFAPHVGMGFCVIVSGQPRIMNAAVQDEIYYISREALINAFRHSEASALEVEIEYGSRQLRVVVRDDGRGIDPKVVEAGRKTHWGLSGMRERAERIRGKLRLWSKPGAGTEVEVCVPSHIAFAARGARTHSSRL